MAIDLIPEISPYEHDGYLVYVSGNSIDELEGRLIELRFERTNPMHYEVSLYGNFLPIYIMRDFKDTSDNVDRVFVKVPSVGQDVSVPLLIKRVRVNNQSWGEKFFVFVEDFEPPTYIGYRTGSNAYTTVKGFEIAYGKVFLKTTERLPLKLKGKTTYPAYKATYYCYNPSEMKYLWEVKVDNGTVYINGIQQGSVEIEENMEFELGWSDEHVRIVFFSGQQIKAEFGYDVPLNQTGVSDTVLEIEGDDVEFWWLMLFQSAVLPAEVMGWYLTTDVIEWLMTGAPRLMEPTQWGKVGKYYGVAKQEIGLERTITELERDDTFGEVAKLPTLQTQNSYVEVNIQQDLSAYNFAEVAMEQDISNNHFAEVSCADIDSTDVHKYGEKAPVAYADDVSVSSLLAKIYGKLQQEIGMQRSVGYREEHRFGEKATFAGEMTEQAGWASIAKNERMHYDLFSVIIDVVQKLQRNVIILSEAVEKYGVAAYESGLEVESEE